MTGAILTQDGVKGQTGWAHNQNHQPQGSVLLLIPTGFYQPTSFSLKSEQDSHVRVVIGTFDHRLQTISRSLQYPQTRGDDLVYPCFRVRFFVMLHGCCGAETGRCRDFSRWRSRCSRCGCFQPDSANVPTHLSAEFFLKHASTPICALVSRCSAACSRKG